MLFQTPLLQTFISLQLLSRLKADETKHLETTSQKSVVFCFCFLFLNSCALCLLVANRANQPSTPHEGGLVLARPLGSDRFWDFFLPSILHSRVLLKCWFFVFLSYVDDPFVFTSQLFFQQYWIDNALRMLNTETATSPKASSCILSLTVFFNFPWTGKCSS